MGKLPVRLKWYFIILFITVFFMGLYTFDSWLHFLPYPMDSDVLLGVYGFCFSIGNMLWIFEFEREKSVKKVVS